MDQAFPRPSPIQQEGKMKTLGRRARIATLAAFVAGATTLAVAQPVHGATSTCFGKPATIVGSGTITGTAGNDVIIGSATTRSTVWVAMT
jgi:hypothetical protein